MPGTSKRDPQRCCVGVSRFLEGSRGSANRLIRPDHRRLSRLTIPTGMAESHPSALRFQTRTERHASFIILWSTVGSETDLYNYDDTVVLRLELPPERSGFGMLFGRVVLTKRGWRLPRRQRSAHDSRRGGGPRPRRFQNVPKDFYALGADEHHLGDDRVDVSLEGKPRVRQVRRGRAGYEEVDRRLAVGQELRPVMERLNCPSVAATGSGAVRRLAAWSSQCYPSESHRNGERNDESCEDRRQRSACRPPTPRPRQPHDHRGAFPKLRPTRHPVPAPPDAHRPEPRPALRSRPRDRGRLL